jgi:hypothetical protein
MKLFNFLTLRRPAVFCLLFLSVSGLKADPPRVLKAIPDNEAQDVDPSLSELRLEFDQPMSQDGMSIVGGGPNFPKLIGKPRWVNERTLTFNWRLEPEHDYWLSINNQRFQNFRNLKGEPAKPYPIAFRTGKGTASPSAADDKPAQVQFNREAVIHLKRALDEDYSYRDLRKVDWEQRFRDFTPKLEAAASPRQFADLAAQLLSPAKDIHLWLRVGESTVYTWQRRAAWNVARNSLPSRIPRWQRRNGIVSTGQFDDGIRYLYISSWPGDGRELMEPAYRALTEATEAGKPLIIDVRANGGGSETLAAEFAGCFVSQPVVYARHLVCRHGKFSPPMDRVLEPNSGRPKFKGRVIVLAGAGTVSSCESFVMMMKQVPGCAIVGEHTAGCSGNPKPVDLGNGVVVFFPSWKDLNLDGACLEGVGFAPDVEVKATQEQLRNGDPVLEAALRLLHP